MNPRPFLHLCLSLAAAVAASRADEKLELSRITPVDANQPVPILDFVRRDILRNPTFNPAGTHLAALITDEEAHGYAAVVDLKTNTPEFFNVQYNGVSLHGIEWLDDQRLLAFGSGLYAGEIGKLGSAYPLLRDTNAALIGIPRQDRTHPIVWVGWGTESGVNDLGPTRIDSSLNLGLRLSESNMGRRAESQEISRRHIVTNFPRVEGVTGAATYYPDKDGALAYATGGDNGFEKLYRLEGEKWVACPIDLDAVLFKGAGNESNQIVVVPRTSTGKPFPLQFANAVTGALGEVLFQDKAYDATTASLYRDRRTGVIVGAKLNRGTRTTVWFDEDYRSVQKIIESSFPGLRVEIVDNNEAGNRFLVATWSDRQPAAYHWVDLASRQASLVKQSRPWISPQRSQPTNVIKYPTRDGRTLDAFVTLPAGATKASPVPLVVFPGNNPGYTCLWGYDALTQFLASRGYAVMRPNHRAAGGYNWMYEDKDRYDFLAISDDLADAAAALLKSGLIDTKRVGIMGAGFGAYFALEGVTRHPDLFRCAVSINGFFDWEALMSEMKYSQHENNDYAYYRRKLGDPKVEVEKFRQLSPLNFIGQARAAVFISHDKADSDIYRAQSKRLLAEVERCNLTHESYFAPEVTLDKDRLGHEVELYTRIEAFLDKNLKGAR